MVRRRCDGHCRARLLCDRCLARLAQPDPGSPMSPEHFVGLVLDPGLAFLASVLPSDPAAVSSDRLRVELAAIAGQETGWSARRQVGGPARSYWQMESMGGVHGVLTHPVSAPR